MITNEKMCIPGYTLFQRLHQDTILKTTLNDLDGFIYTVLQYNQGRHRALNTSCSEDIDPLRSETLKKKTQ